MTLKTYSGACHCGKIRFEADLDIAAGTVKCNCSGCTKARSWLIFVTADRYRLLAGRESQRNYQWTPSDRPAPTVEYHFCNHCGIRTPASGNIEALGGSVYAIQVPLLDGVDQEELAKAPTRYVDGRYDRFDRPPADIRFL
jgi:hypothetical protein